MKGRQAITGKPRTGAEIYADLREQIADGRLAPGDPLPSTRALAARLAVSRTTVTAAFKRLRSDGLIETRPGARTCVSRDLPAPDRAPADRTEAAPRLSDFGVHLTIAGQPRRPSQPAEIEFRYGDQDQSAFPAAQWRRSMARAIATPPTVPDAQGAPELRVALQSYLQRVRGLHCAADQIVIVGSGQQALDLCARLILSPGMGAVVENPGRPEARAVLAAHGARLRPVGVDASGLCTGQLDGIQAGLALISATHHFPLGGGLPAARRHALLDWAARTEAYVIDDDRDAEFRYDMAPSAPLQAIDPHGRVIHLGGFGHILSASLELAYLVLPRGLVATFAAAQKLIGYRCSMHEQLALADMLNTGSLDRHMRRQRRRHSGQHATLTAALAGLAGVRAQGTAAGLHLTVWLPHLEHSQEQLFCHRARHAGLGLSPLGPCYAANTGADRPAGVVMGFAALDPVQIELGVRRLEKQLRQFRP